MTLDELMNELASDFPDISAIMGENDSVVLGSVECGSTILIGDRSYIVLEHRDDGTTAVITKDFWKDMEFDNDSGDYAESAVRNALNTEFYNEVSSEIGDENIITPAAIKFLSLRWISTAATASSSLPTVPGGGQPPHTVWSILVAFASSTAMAR